MVRNHGLLLPLTLLLCSAQEPSDEGLTFQRFRLTRDFFSEGGNHADLDGDGHGDVISGPYWYAGPDFAKRFELYAPKPFDPLRYSDNFFAFPHDFDGDGWTDILFVGFPGQTASWLHNPAEKVRGAGHWTRHVVFDVVDNEAPGFADLTGDGAPELFFHTGGRFGWAGPGEDPTQPWVFHPLSADIGLPKFVHGLGLGDIDGDGKNDLLEKNGWWEQPDSLAGDPLWTRHAFAFGDRIGGAQMLVFDVNGDGKNDVVTSLHAHAYGLSWFEQIAAEDGGITFREHLLVDDSPEDNPHGVRFSEPHALDAADVNGDGLMDFVTGKRWWSHGPDGAPDGDTPSPLYWFELVRHADGTADFVPHLIDDDSGVGVQVIAGDVNGDGKVDVVVGNKKGAFVFIQEDEDDKVGYLPRGDDGRPLNLDFETGDLTDWTAAGEAFAGQPVRGDTIAARDREPSLHQGEYWIGGYELVGDEPAGTLTSAAFRVSHPWASFLVGGGAYEAIRLELHVEGGDPEKPFFTTSGIDYESMQRVVVDLRPYDGRRIFVRINDRHTWGWGHLNFDDFRFHGQRPVFERPDHVPAIFPLDDVANAGLTPREAPAAMSVPAGFQVELIAGEPELHQPIALTIDPRGRLWVVEAHTYPQRAPDGEGQDEIVVFEDRDGDGGFEHRTVFAKGLNLVSGLEVGFGGVWVGAAPYLYFIPDRDDDLVPDGEPQVLLDGWGYQDTHETLNAFNWGPDGWLYGCHGVFTHSKVGKPGTPDVARVAINAGVWRFHPQRHEFEVFAWGTSTRGASTSTTTARRSSRPA